LHHTFLDLPASHAYPNMHTIQQNPWEIPTYNHTSIDTCMTQGLKTRHLSFLAFSFNHILHSICFKICSTESTCPVSNLSRVGKNHDLAAIIVIIM